MNGLRSLELEKLFTSIGFKRSPPSPVYFRTDQAFYFADARARARALVTGERMRSRWACLERARAPGQSVRGGDALFGASEKNREPAFMLLALPAHVFVCAVCTCTLRARVSRLGALSRELYLRRKNKSKRKE